jgi:phosphatidylglycerol---prolipoprotein diacylglyceryl transferase
MRKVLLTWNGVTIYSYPAALYLGMVVGVFVGAYMAQLSGMDPNSFAVAATILLIPGLIGARLFFVFLHWHIYAAEPRRILGRGEGGMAMYGAILVALPISLVLLPAMQLPFGAFWDAGTFTMLIIATFGRIGCLLNGCCGGRPTSSWCGIDLPDHRGVWQRRIPVQLFEMAWTAALLATLILLRGREPFAGALFCFALLAYGAFRFALQPFREDLGARDTPVLRATSLLLVLAALAGFIFAAFG